MIIKENESLEKYTTLKIGGIAAKFYIPESVNDLIETINKVGRDYYILANGSNLLINDKKTYNNVIYMNKFNMSLEIDNGIITAGASLKIQELINFSNKNNFGGIEYLYSVPATVGGAIYMNAGRGRSFNQCISDYIVDVTVFDGEKILTIDREQCEFSYRTSLFKSKTWIILSARFEFKEMSKEETTELKKERIELVKKVQHSGKPNAGTVFRKSNAKIMSLLRKLHPGWKNGVMYSPKTNNWLVNNGNGTFRQAIFLINFNKFIHKLFLKDAELEYIVWE